MPSLIDLRRRVRSVKNTQQITKAMKMVSAARLRRAQERAVSARPYSQSWEELLARVTAAVGSNETLLEELPLLRERAEERVVLVLLTSDRGLAGAFNSNLIKASQRFVDARAGKQVELELIGRKGVDYWRRRNGNICGETVGISQKGTYADVEPIVKRLIARYEREEIDAIYLLYNEFKSMLAQKLTERRLLPIRPEQGGGDPVGYIFEQPPVEMLRQLLPQSVALAMYRALIESAAAEHAARMTAMEAATTNAADVIEKLTLFMNRVRQASITKEIIEVVSGAAAGEESA